VVQGSRRKRAVGVRTCIRDCANVAHARSLAALVKARGFGMTPGCGGRFTRQEDLIEFESVLIARARRLPVPRLLCLWPLPLFFSPCVYLVEKLRSDHSHNGCKPWVIQGDLSSAPCASDVPHSSLAWGGCWVRVFPRTCAARHPVLASMSVAQTLDRGKVRSSQSQNLFLWKTSRLFDHSGVSS
jgi:hypothetical protein